MKPIVVTARQADWAEAQKTGKYEQSTIDSTLAEIGFIHATSPDQTIAMINRKYADQDDLILLLVDPSKVTTPIKYEGSLSGRAGTYPHIYGPLNIDAVYQTHPLQKQDGLFVTPSPLFT